MASRSKWRWLKWTALVLAAALVVAAVGLWFALPTLVESGLQRFATAIGLDHASVEVSRADLSGLRARALRLEKGALAVGVEETSADYSVRELMGGQLTRAEVSDLTLKLDFTRPRRGLLPDAVGDLLGLLGGGGELVWPVGELVLENCRVDLVLPEGTQTLSLSGTARRQDDGRVAFDISLAHPGLDLHATGTARTETMDADVVVERLGVQPERLLNIAAQLGLLELPADLTYSTEPIALEGRASFTGGVPGAATASLHAPALRIRFAGADVAVDSLEASLTRSASGELAATLGANVSASGEQGWKAGPTHLDVKLDRGRVTGNLSTLAASFADQASAHLSLALETGLPKLGGPAEASARVQIAEARFSDMRFAPATLEARGWLDEVRISASPLGLAEESPAELVGLALTITDPLGAAKSAKGSLAVNLNPAAASLLPAGWLVAAPALPVETLRVELEGSLGDTGPKATAKLSSPVPHVQVKSGEQSFATSPTLSATLTFADDALAASASIDLKEIETDAVGFPPGVSELAVGFELPRLSLSAINDLTARTVPKDDLAMKLTAGVVHSETRGDSYIEVQHFGQAAESALEAWAMLDNVSGAWAGTNVKGLQAEATLRSGRLREAQVRDWLAHPPSVVELVRALLGQTEVHLSVTAPGIDLAETLRTEWTGFWVRKTPPAAGAPPIATTITAYAGNVRAGPETIEQPTLEIKLAGTPEAITAQCAFRGMLEGSQVAAESAQQIRVDWPGRAASGDGTFSLGPLTLKQSDIVSRWAPDFVGLALSATASAEGTLAWSTAGEWDGTARVELGGGEVQFPAQALRAEGIRSSLQLTSLKDLRTTRGQRLQFSRLALGDLEITNGDAHFAAEGPGRLLIENASARVFGGNVSVGSFMLLFPDPDVGLVLEFEGLDADELVRQLKLFKGTMTGQLRGRLPVGLLAGRPILGEGYLELDPRVPSVFRMDASGIFTADLPNATAKDRIVRLPYEMLEEALGNLAIRTMRIDFFERDRPETPIRLEFSGESITPRARVPLTIVTNVNGSVAEALNFLLRLAML